MPELVPVISTFDIADLLRSCAATPRTFYTLLSGTPSPFLLRVSMAACSQKSCAELGLRLGRAGCEGREGTRSGPSSLVGTTFVPLVVRLRSPNISCELRRDLAEASAEA